MERFLEVGLACGFSMERFSEVNFSLCYLDFLFADVFCQGFVFSQFLSFRFICVGFLILDLLRSF